MIIVIWLCYKTELLSSKHLNIYVLDKLKAPQSYGPPLIQNLFIRHIYTPAFPIENELPSLGIIDNSENPLREGISSTGCAENMKS